MRHVSSPMNLFDRQPITDIGDVVIHHLAPKLWVPCAITANGDVNGRPTTAVAARRAALAAAQSLLLPGRRIYIRHHDDAEWEEVRVLTGTDGDG
jgi:hypothetical protein